MLFVQLRGLVLLVIMLATLAIKGFAFSVPVAGSLARRLAGSSKLSKHILLSSTSNMPRVVVLNPLPVVNVYDHCPYCVRVRLALGLKNVKHDIRFLLNDDIETPTSLVGRKITPIFERAGSIPAMAESMDIIRRIDTDPEYGPINFFKPASGRKDIQDWMKNVADISRIHQRSRYIRTYLPEFATRDARNAFVRNHHMPPLSETEWKNNLDDDARWKIYAEAAMQSLQLIPQTNAALLELDEMLFSVNHCTEGGLSLDDIELWSRLRSLTLVKGVEFPTRVKAYLDTLADQGDVPTYFSIAC